jgi:hypothetical protein
LKVQDLKTLTAKLLDHVKKQKTEELFERFLRPLRNSLGGNRQPPQQPVTKEKEDLFASLRSFDQLALTYSEAGLFSLLEYGTFVGGSAADALDSILHDEQFDPVGVLKQLEAKHEAFKTFVERNRQVAVALKPVRTLEETALQAGESLLEITFLDKAAVDNVVDFAHWIDVWTRIIRAFSQLAGNKPESARIVFVQKSSPLIIDVAAACALVLVVGKAVDSVLEKVERYLRIRRQLEEIKKLKLENKQIEKGLSDEAEAFSDKVADDITGQLTGDAKGKFAGDVVNGVKLAVKDLFIFVDKGGRVDCASTAEEDAGDMADVFADVRRLQEAVDQLRLPPPDPEDEE